MNFYDIDHLYFVAVVTSGNPNSLTVCFLFLCVYKLSLQDILRPASDLALCGFPVAQVTAHHWAKWVRTMRAAGRELGRDFLIKNDAPKHGQVFSNPHLAQTFQVTLSLTEGRISDAQHYSERSVCVCISHYRGRLNSTVYSIDL